MKKITLYILAIGFFLMSCNEDFENINTNPNAPTQVQPSLLLRQVIWDYGEQMSYEGFVAGNLLGQYFTMVDFNLFDRHNLASPQLGGNPWPVIYTNLRDNELILEMASNNASHAVYEGPARIMKAYMAQALTDIYGDVPYSEALKGASGMISPKYDAQSAIYMDDNGLLDQLNKGIAAIDNYTASFPLEGDILFDGDLQAWKRFANSLKIKVLMRMSDKTSVGAQLQAIFVEGDYISDNSQDAFFQFSNSRPNSFRMEQLRDGDFNLFILSETMEEILEGLNDPRMELYFRPNGNDPTGTQYTGLLNGPDASQTSISVSDYALAGTIFRTETGKLKCHFSSAWETNFFLAEAAERNIISADAGQLYETAVQQAFDYWNIEIPSDYLNTIAAYDANGNDPIEQIITQKWLANIINAYEAWTEYRRTGFPNLKAVSASLNDGLYPTRLPYPADEAALNASNYQAATATNDNSVNAKVWWDN